MTNDPEMILPEAEEMAAAATRAAGFLQSLASPHRLMVLCRLIEAEMSVGDLNEGLGLTPSNLSRHLATLRDEGLVATRRDGTTIYYSIASERVRPILAELYRQFCPGAVGAGEETAR